MSWVKARKSIRLDKMKKAKRKAKPGQRLGNILTIYIDNKSYIRYSYCRKVGNYLFLQ